jgi:phenylalanyl-tRNA synthetase beta chain
VEEVVRIAGLDKVPSAAMPRMSGVARPVLTPLQKRVRRARRVLAGRGMVEAITWSFIKGEESRHFGGGTEALELANPISTEMTSMRPSLLPGLLSAVQRNNHRGFSDVALFEVGQVYRGAGEKDQFIAAAGVRSGSAALTGSGRHWAGNAKAADMLDAKADALRCWRRSALDAGRAQLTRDAPSWFHPGRSGVVRLGPRSRAGQFRRAASRNARG